MQNQTRSTNWHSAIDRSIAIDVLAPSVLVHQNALRQWFGIIFSSRCEWLIKKVTCQTKSLSGDNIVSWLPHTFGTKIIAYQNGWDFSLSSMDWSTANEHVQMLWENHLMQLYLSSQKQSRRILTVLLATAEEPYEGAGCLTKKHRGGAQETPEAVERGNVTV